jgi:hypothetical protein
MNLWIRLFWACTKALARGPVYLVLICWARGILSRKSIGQYPKWAAGSARVI